MLLSYRFMYKFLTFTQPCKRNRVESPTRHLGRRAIHDLVGPKFPNNLCGAKAVFLYAKSTVESA